MLELIKVIVDLFVLRDTAKRGMFSWKLTGMAFVVVISGYVIALSTEAYYEKHPGAKPLFVAVMISLVMGLAAFLWWGWRYQTRLAASREAALATSEPVKQEAQV